MGEVKRLQQYDKHHLRTLTTGLLGCRWHRYQQCSKNTKCDIGWFAILSVTFILQTFWFYFWLVCMDNDKNDFNWKASRNAGSEYNWIGVLVAINSVLFAYAFFIMFLSMVHVILGQEIYMHIVHKVVVIVVFVFVLIEFVVVKSQYARGYDVFGLSLKAFGPFLQIGAVLILTLFSILMIKQWFRIRRKAWRIISMVVYLIIALFIYLSPLSIDTPCITDKSLLKPNLTAHRGAASVSPENTLMSYEVASKLPGVIILESDVMVSSDSNLFLLHDDTFKRTTNIADVFPDRVNEDSFNFSSSEIKMLNAGEWFIDKDPFGTVSDLSEAERTQAANQSVGLFSDILDVALKSDHSVMFDLTNEVFETDHSLRDQQVELVKEAVKKSGLPPDHVIWLYENILDGETNFTRAYKGVDLEYIEKYKPNMLNLNISLFTFEDIRHFQELGLHVNVYTIDASWLYSLYWCAGINSVTTNFAYSFSSMSSPNWTMSPDTYTAIWICVDFFSALIICAIFGLYLRKQSYAQQFTSEVLQTAQQRITPIRPPRNMKEKLILAEETATQGDTSFEQDTRYQADLEDGRYGGMSTTQDVTDIKLQELQSVA